MSDVGMGELAVVLACDANAVVHHFSEQCGPQHSTFARRVCLCCDAPAPDGASAEYLMIMCVPEIATIVIQPMCRSCTDGQSIAALNSLAMQALARVMPSFEQIPDKSEMH